MPAPTITPLPDEPLRSDAPATFVSKAEAWVAAFPGLTDEINALAAYLDDLNLEPGTAASTTQTTEGFPGGIGSPSDKSYTIGLNMPHGGTITSTTTKSLSGTCTATFKIGSTALGGTANSVSSSEQAQAHASNNVFAAGDDIVLTVSSNSSCVDLAWMIKYTRTLE